jgi:hypothetical protein
MYGLVPPPLAAGLPLAPPPDVQAARITAAPPRMVSNRFDFMVLVPVSFLANNLSRLVSSGSYSQNEPIELSCALLQLLTAADDVEVDGENDDHADNHDLPLLWYGHDPQAVGEGADDERADDGAQDRALAA